MTQFISLFTTAVSFGTVIMFGAMGEILTEKSGQLNLGVPGIMYLGGIAGLIGAFLYELNNPAANGTVGMLIALGCALAAAALGGLIYAFLTITLRANQNVTGLTLTIFGSGLANFFGGSLNKMAGGVGQISVALTSRVFCKTLTITEPLGAVHKLFFNFGYMTYLAIALAILLSWVLNRTSVGLNLRAVGENPATADAAGINVTRYRYVSTMIGSGIAGLGGL
ncbi:MAG: ABC transporter permease, partial [Clostridia bacterium]|nr:ABC transporter permease [Clostridia bacterium]